METKTMPRNPRHDRLLADEDVARWYRNLARGNETTAKDWLRKLGLFCERKNTTPAALLSMDQEAVGDLLEDYVDEYPRTSTAKVLTVVRSLFARKGIRIVREITMPDVEHRDQHVPSRAQLRKALSGANRRAKAAIGIVAFGGQRLQVLGNGKDALRLGDIVDFRIIENADGSQDIRFEMIPTRFIVRKPLSKTKKSYFSFLGAEAVGYIESYLRARMESGERLSRNTVVIGAVKHRIHGKEKRETLEGGDKPISTANVSDFIRKALRAGGIRERPYILRSYFAVHADMCSEYPGDWREFNMGHQGHDTVLKTYTVNKELPPEKIGAMRAAYAKALPLVETTEPEALTRLAELERALTEIRKERANPEQVTMAELRKESAVATEIAKAGTDVMSEGEITARAEVDRLSQLLADAMDDSGELVEMVGNNGGTARAATQKIVSEADLDPLLADGWEFVSVLPSGKVVIRREGA
jgi:hypothetical protein